MVSTLIAQAVSACSSLRISALRSPLLTGSLTQPHKFAPGSVFHLLEPDINQELYGMPEYLSALNSAWLNESATLFRRKYYQNGAHAGYKIGRAHV